MTRARFATGIAVAALFAALAPLITVGCSSPPAVDVEYDWDGDYEFAKFDSWSWMPGEQPKIPDPRVADSAVDARMRRTIEGEMATRGLKRLESGIPDMWVQYRIWIMPRRDFNPVRDSNVRPLPDPPKEDALDDVGLRIEMFDSFDRTKRIWSGELRTRLNLRVSGTTRTERTIAAVRKLLTQFPPAPPE
jgi:hypothetical protein